MRICFITPSLEKGGMERVLVELAHYGINEGIDIVILSILPDRPIAYELDGRVQYLTPSYKYNEGLIFKVKSLLYLYKSIKRIKPDMCLCFSETFNPLGIIACKLYGVPIFISDRSNPLKKVGKIKYILKRCIYPFANGLIAQTKFAHDIFKEARLNNNIEVIPNPLKDMPLLSRDSQANQQNLIISVGRLVPTKNFKQLIYAFSKTDYKEWKLIILGEGRERKNLEILINQLGLSEYVSLEGQVDNVDSYLSLAKIFAFTSLSEGFPNALSEAMAFPLACIALDCPAGPSDIIKDDENGFLVSIGAEKEYIEKLERLMKDSLLRESFCRKAILNRSKFSKENTSKKYFDFITK